MTFLDRLCQALTAPQLVQTDAQRRLIGRAIADTLGCAAAGFAEPVTRSALAAYSGQGATAWSGAACESAEAAVMINGIAAHALDFDDVYLESMAHISTVLVPAILTEPAGAPEVIFDAYAAGLIAAKAVARRVGQGHYNKGWHGTGTMGAFGAAAAIARLRGLPSDRIADAFALVAAMSGGLRVNFSTPAKPAHAGFAAVAGLRAVRLAEAGISGSREVFSEAGYPGLYGTGDGEPDPDDDAFALCPDRISVKLYPCCYATHRLVGIALDARKALGAGIGAAGNSYQLTVPEGSMDALVPGHPTTGLQARFSAAYCFACAITGGAPTLVDFEDAAVGRADITAAMARLSIIEDASQPNGRNIEAGEVRLHLQTPDGKMHDLVRTALPGSPLDPPDTLDLSAKLDACLQIYASVAGHPFPMIATAQRLGVADWIGAQITAAAQ